MTLQIFLKCIAIDNKSVNQILLKLVWKKIKKSAMGFDTHRQVLALKLAHGKENS